MRSLTTTSSMWYLVAMVVHLCADARSGDLGQASSNLTVANSLVFPSAGAAVGTRLSESILLQVWLPAQCPRMALKEFASCPSALKMNDFKDAVNMDPEIVVASFVAPKMARLAGFLPNVSTDLLFDAPYRSLDKAYSLHKAGTSPVTDTSAAFLVVS